ncbi:MAG: matrixin family metalloprotease, partial [Nitrosopumilus sp.]|nr:matrixin family metalloprotease [Nitrosopumilus sp.]
MNGLRCELVVENNKTHFKQYLNGKESQTETGRKWKKSFLTYSIMKGTIDTPGDAEETRVLSLALQTWGVEVPIVFIRVHSTQSPDIRVEFKNKIEEPEFAEKPSILAFAWYPEQGDFSGLIIFNEEYVWAIFAGSKTVTNPDGSISIVRVYSIFIVMTHELGHTLGLAHDEHGDTKDMMDPYYDPNVIALSTWDIYRIRAIYGI